VETPDEPIDVDAVYEGNLGLIQNKVRTTSKWRLENSCDLLLTAHLESSEGSKNTQDSIQTWVRAKSTLNPEQGPSAFYIPAESIPEYRCTWYTAIAIKYSKQSDSIEIICANDFRAKAGQ